MWIKAVVMADNDCCCWRLRERAELKAIIFVAVTDDGNNIRIGEGIGDAKIRWIQVARGVGWCSVGSLILPRG